MKRSRLTFVLLLALLLLTAALAAGEEPAETLDRPISDVEPLLPRSYLPFVRGEKDVLDMANFLVGDGRLYEVWHSNDSQARHQTQGSLEALEDEPFYHTKGVPLAEWEELWMDDEFVYRGTDTSPGGGLYYTLRDGGQYGSKWSPRHWRVGDVYERFPWVTFYYKSNCAVESEFPQKTWLRLEAYYPELTLGSGEVVREVVVLDWLLAIDGPPAERYYYARDYGLVAWENSHGDFSYLSEKHDPGSRPDNTREVIDCLDTGDRPVPAQPDFPARPYEPPHRAK